MILKLILKLFSKSIYYVGNIDNLPEPLTKEEESILIDRAISKDKDAINKLIEHNLRLVVFLAKKYDYTNLDLEDLVSIGTIGLIKGVNTYKNDKNIKLATYVSRCIDNEILMFLRKMKKRKGEISLEDSLSTDSSGSNLHLEDVLGTDKDIVSKSLLEDENKKMLYEELEKLSGREKDIICLRYGLLGKKEMTQKDVANLLGISQSYISRIEKKVISRLKIITRT